MKIDWFTIGAQALNFLILVFFISRFLYKPILDAIDDREKRIADEIAAAADGKAKAQQERDEFQRKNEEFEQQRAALMSKAADEAGAERQRLMDEARQAAVELSLKQTQLLLDEEHKLLSSISRRTQQEVIDIARLALTDMANTSLDERMCDVFIQRLQQLDESTKLKLADAYKSSTDPSIVRSAFELPADSRSKIQSALNDVFQTSFSVQFETDPNLISGIELTTHGQKLAWSISDYLTTLQSGIDELIQANNKQHAKEEPKASDTQPAEPKAGDTQPAEPTSEVVSS